jgi:long-chain acyl-CoA synthetase
MFALSQLLKGAVQINHGGAATIYGDRVRTWSELQDRIARLAGALRALGVRNGDRVAILALNSDRYYEYYFAVPWAGAVFVPVNTRLAPPEVGYWLNDSKSKVLFVDQHFVEAHGRIRDQLKTVETVIYLGEGETPDGMLAYEALIGAEPPVEDAGRCDDDLTALLYTGGTTGRSKGVMLSHRNIVANVLQSLRHVPMSISARALHAAPMFHAADGFFCMCGVTVAATNVIIPAFEPAATMKTIAAARVESALLIPTMINMVVNHPQLPEHDLSCLKHIIYGASPMPEAVIRKAMEELPQVRFIQAYGQTEASPVLTMLGPEDHAPDGPHPERLKSAGRALPGVELAIFDEHDQPVPNGEVGEICARGANVMLGYWNLPDSTEAALRNGWLHTGDGGRLDDDGYLYIVDRVKDMIVSGGENVYSAETENAVYQHPAVAECAVIGIPHDTWGEQVHAIVRLKPGASVSEEELIEHCKTLIAGYKCPRSIEFREAPLPLSGAGKILKKDLRAPYWEDRRRGVH